MPRPKLPESKNPRPEPRALDRLKELYSPAIEERLQRWERPMLPPPPALPQSWREVELRLDDPHKWYAGYLGVRDAEVEIPYELRQDLRQAVPQALLRDLYRPAWREQLVLRIPLDEERDPGGRAAYREARAALVREPLPIVRPSTEEVLRAQQHRRRIFRDRWEPYRPDDAPRMSREIGNQEDAE